QELGAGGAFPENNFPRRISASIQHTADFAYLRFSVVAGGDQCAAKHALTMLAATVQHVPYWPQALWPFSETFQSCHYFYFLIISLFITTVTNSN
ncbi:MAG: hypothetical protein KGM40_06430, partial [Betaproteobacteria bacterium]|nr:hypothetical protein [Betaproteobacteria bacterium]